MQRLNTLASWREFAASVRASDRRVGLVATMGALHDGHLSLVRRARANHDVVILTSFVNPRQFSDEDDLRSYPRTPEADARAAEATGVSAFVTPALEEMWPEYPGPTLTTVSVSELGERWEGEGRPGHFDGVASVVAKLFTLTGPCRAYFGEKDYQQLVVVRRVVRDLAFDVDVVGCATRRLESGLALSSRNARLSRAGLVQASALSRALTAASDSRATPSERRVLMAGVMGAAGVEVDYAEIVESSTLRPLHDEECGRARALVAGVVEGVRLIDNAEVELGTKGG